MHETPGPRISVVIPVLNGGKFLEKCVLSIIEKKVTFEILIVDNGSTDETSMVSRKLTSKYSNIRYLTSRPRDISTALNTGIKAATGEFIARLDSDDLSTPNRLWKQVQYLREHPDCVMVGGRMEYIDFQGTELGVQENFKNGNITIQNFYSGNPVAHPSVMFRRKAFEAAGQYKSKWNKVEDLDLWIRLSRIGQIHNLDEIVTKYRRHSNQISSSTEASLTETTFRIKLAIYLFMRLKPFEDQKLNLIRIAQVLGIIFPNFKKVFKNLMSVLNAN
jgi:glycosyltransferase involved in cell wall biosynthesis